MLKLRAFICLCLAAALVFALSACTDGNGSDTTAADTTLAPDTDGADTTENADTSADTTENDGFDLPMVPV